MAQSLVELICQHFSGAVVATHAEHGDETVVVTPELWHRVAEFLRDEPAASMNMLVDLTAVDYPDRLPRFEVVAHFLSLSLGHRLRLKTRVGGGDGSGAELDTLTDLWASANWMERECFDLFGVVFRSHPDLRRILLYPEFVGHPLRKDYPAERAQPIVPYREVPNIDKLAPFGPDEGMSFGRKTYDLRDRAEVEDDC
ncbi:MAG: NADH-quinone oxidoreductase subunit C [Polyangiaceae bacterium]|nr:NADH-quinone oxidoreductase subunit C [Polyangiaceae bacterium]